MSGKLTAMPPLRLPRKTRPSAGPLAHHKEVTAAVTEAGDSPGDLVRLFQRSCALLRESHAALAKPKLVDLSEQRPCRPALQLLSASAQLSGLRARLDSLQHEADSLLSSGEAKAAGVVTTSASAGLLVGRVFMPAAAGKEAVVPLHVTLRSLRQLQLQFMR